MEVMVVSPECRQRDSLVSMLESIIHPSVIKTVEVCSDVIEIANQDDPSIVFVDYREPELVANKEISSLIMNSAIYFVVLLTSYKGPDSHFTHFSTCELVYDEVSIEVLTNLLKNIQLKSIS